MGRRSRGWCGLGSRPDRKAWTERARLQLFDHDLAPLADLPVREIVSASHVLTDLTLAPITTMHD